MNIPAEIMSERGVLRTYFSEKPYGMTDSCTDIEADGIFSCLSVGEDKGIIKYSGKIYVDGQSSCASELAYNKHGASAVSMLLDVGEVYIKNIRAVRFGNMIHHFELEV